MSRQTKLDSGQQARILDLATQLVDTSRAAVAGLYGSQIESASLATQVAVQVAVQAVVTASLMDAGEASRPGFVAVPPDVTHAVFAGLGQGLGQSLGGQAVQGGAGVAELMGTVWEAAERALADRMIVTQREWKERPR